MRAYSFLPFILIGTLPLESVASTAVGNPSFTITLVDGDTVHVEDVVATPCSGPSDTVSVDTTVSKESPTTVLLGEDLYCQLDVVVVWSTGSPSATVLVDDLDELKVVAGGGNWSIDLDESNGPATFVEL